MMGFLERVREVYVRGDLTTHEMNTLIELHYYLAWKRKPWWKRALVTLGRVIFS